MRALCRDRETYGPNSHSTNDFVGSRSCCGRDCASRGNHKSNIPQSPDSFTVTHVYVLGPLYPKEQKGYFDMPPDTRLTYDQFRTPFHKFDDPDSPQFAGYWVTVSP